MTIPLICAHRGASANYPENTLRSFIKALEQKADALEIDVRQTGDGQLVACHDFNLSRLTGEHVRLSEISLEEFKRMKINNLEPPASLDEIFSEVGTSPRIVLDIKESRLERKILGMVTERKLEDKIILSSFDPRILAILKRLNPEIKTALIAGPLSLLPLALNVCFYLRKVSEYTNCDYMHLHYMNILYPGYHTLAKWGYKISYWTVDHPRDIRNVISLNAESIITNRPGLARAILNRVIK
jgi:glycerophosphoryl diester phosphodiesterase